MYLAFLPFCLQTPVSPQRRFPALPLSALGFFLAEVWASPNPGMLAAITGRIEVVILRTGSSLPVAPHLVSGLPRAKQSFSPLSKTCFGRVWGSNNAGNAWTVPTVT